MQARLDEILGKLDKLPPQALAELDRVTPSAIWSPNPGSQTDAWLSEADEIGYGGEAGPGKTDLLIGLSLLKHDRSLLLRRTTKEAKRLIERYEEILGSRDGWNGQDHSLRLPGRLIEFGGCEHEDDKQSYKGNPHDLIAFDEVVDFSQSQYEFIIGWNRSSNRKQRCRIVATMNPPTRPSGLWVLKRWGPWLDPKHPRPAKSGEIRWFTSVDGIDKEVEGRGPHDIDGKPVYAKSRTFIRAFLHENPTLAGTGYEGRLAGLPKELRSAYLEGNFGETLRDAPNQCIPTSWVRSAQDRWTPEPPHGVPMCSIGVDASGGGDDQMVIARRHDGWYAKLVAIPGREIPEDRMGPYAAGQVLSYREDQAFVIVDVGGGYGSSLYDHLSQNDIEVRKFLGAERTERRSRDARLRFVNGRSAAYWLFREALDPGQPGGSPIMLDPSDSLLLAELTTPIFEVTPNGIKLERKEDVVQRLGHSPDRADAVVMAWWAGPKETDSALEWATGRQFGRRVQVVRGRRH